MSSCSSRPRPRSPTSGDCWTPAQTPWLHRMCRLRFCTTRRCCFPLQHIVFPLLPGKGAVPFHIMKEADSFFKEDIEIHREEQEQGTRIGGDRALLTIALQILTLLWHRCAHKASQRVQGRFGRDHTNQLCSRASGRAELMWGSRCTSMGLSGYGSW